MAREEAIEVLKNNCDYDRYYIGEVKGKSQEAIDMAISALSENKDTILDKIADEVNKLKKVGYEGKVYVPINAVFDIIDKYRAESEDK